jgi:hypothetical protein
MLNYIPWGDYVLKAVFYWIEVKKQTLFFVVILFFVLIHVQKSFTQAGTLWYTENL